MPTTPVCNEPCGALGIGCCFGPPGNQYCSLCLGSSSNGSSGSSGGATSLVPLGGNCGGANGNCEPGLSCNGGICE
jgi:hypothetical protein